MADLSLSMSDSVIDWREIAIALYPAARTGGCTCAYERTKGGVPIWFPAEGGGIVRKLIRRCSRCIALEMHETAILSEET